MIQNLSTFPQFIDVGGREGAVENISKSKVINEEEDNVWFVVVGGGGGGGGGSGGVGFRG